MDGPDRQDPSREPWQEGPEEGTPAESWLGLSDDELLHKIETIGSPHDADQRLLEVVASGRHFFIRQEAAKRIRRKKLLFPYEDDRHIGQILVRHLNRREDLTYLERLVARSTHSDVRKAASVQLGRLRKRLSDQARRDDTRRAQGQRPWRIVVVHPDPAVRRTVADTLPAPDYEVMGLGPDEGAVAAILTFDPHLLFAAIEALLGPELPAATAGRGRPLPVVVLCEIAAAARLPEVVGKSADEYMLLPLLPGLLASKTQALLHLAHLAPVRADRRKASGAIGDDGVLPLLKLCEDEQLTCRLVVAAEGARYFADFVDGEMMESGGIPPVDEDEAFAAILAVRTGTYEMIEALPAEDAGDAESEIEVPIPQGVVSSAPAPAPAASPAVAVTPLPEAAAWPMPADVDATLLGWAVHFIVERAWAYLGTAATAGLLRRTLQDGLDRYPVLRVFNVEDNAHVGVDLSQGPRLPLEGVRLTAQWMAVFVAAARRIAPEAAAIDVRQATRIVGPALEQVDFYAAYDRAALQADVKPPSFPIARIIPTRRKD
jgi:hypothetical protein